MYVKRLFIITFCLCVVAISISAQCPDVMPSGTVCLTREAAIKAVETAKELDATKEQLAAEKQANNDLKGLLNDQRVLNAEQAGRILEMERRAVEYRALIDAFAAKKTKRCIFSVCLW